MSRTARASRVAPLVLAANLLPLLAVLSACASPPRAAAGSGGDGAPLDENAPADTPWLLRRARPTRLVDAHAAPAAPAPLHLQPGMEEVRYRSGDLVLMAVVARPPRTPVTSDTPVERAPAVVLLHKGFALDDDTLAQAAPFVDAGFVVMMPSWRGENENPGAYELWRGEVDDAKAATRWLAEDPDVDVDRMYAFGHSAGGGLATLLALDPDVPFRVIASSNGIYAPGTFGRWRKDDPKKVPFDTTNLDEVTVRVLVPNAHELEQRLVLYVGTSDVWSMKHAAWARDRAAAVEKTIDVVELPGDHMGSLDGALARFLDLVKKDAFANESATSRPLVSRSGP